MNKKQRVVLAIFIPVLLFFITVTIAYYISVEVVITPGSGIQRHYDSDENEWKITLDLDTTNKYYDPFDWGRTWYIWVLSLTFCCIFEYRLFGDKKIITNRKKKENK